MLNDIDLSRTDLNLLTLFEIVLQERHVGRAAVRLSLSPSAVSHGLTRLRRLLNDPLFVRHPKGLNPTERALALAVPVAEILDRARTVIAGADVFSPAHSKRRFIVGAVDGISSVLVPGLTAVIAREAPNVTLGVRSVFPFEVVEKLDGGALDVALAPAAALPVRLSARSLYIEDFVIAARLGHPFLTRPTLEAYCAASHLLVAQGSDDRGFVDELLSARGLKRHVTLTVPSFMSAMTVLGETDLVCAIPRRLVKRYGRRLSVGDVDPPIPLPQDTIAAVAAKAATADPGIAWLIERAVHAARA